MFHYAYKLVDYILSALLTPKAKNMA